MSQSHLEIEPTDAYDTTNWVGLFGAEVAASAALTGLIFVAVSINLQRILAFPSLPRRVLKGLCMLGPVLFVSTLGLVPGQPAFVLGLELLALGAGAMLLIVILDVGTWRMTEPPFRSGLVRLMTMALLAAVFTAVAGASLLAHAGWWTLLAGPGGDVGDRGRADRCLGVVDRDRALISPS